MRNWALVLALAIFAAGAFLRLHEPLNHDVSWLFVAAERLLDGGRLGIEIYELNAPAAILLYVPAAILSRLADLAPKVSVLLLTALVASACLVSSRYFLGLLFDEAAGNKWRADGVVLCWAAVWSLLPGYDFAQREHFIVLLLIPFALLEACLSSKITVSRGWELAAAGLASLAMMIKPHFALVPGILLLARAGRYGPLAVLRSVGPYVLLVSGCLYILAVFTFFREWLSVARNAYLLYGAYDGTAPWVLRMLPNAPPPTATHAVFGVAGLILAAFIVHRRDKVLAMAAYNLLLVLLVCTMLYLVQWKGFTYQLLPSTLLALSTASLVIGSLLPPLALGSPLTAAHIVGLVFAALIVRVSLYVAPVGPPVNKRLAEALAARAANGSVYAFTTGMRPLFPIVTEENLRWSSRFPCLWTLVGAYNQRFSPRITHRLSAPELDALESGLIDQVVEDLRRNTPATIVVDVGPQKQWVAGSLDFVKFFSRDPRFFDVWSGYRKVNTVGAYEIYARQPADTVDRRPQ